MRKTWISKTLFCSLKSKRKQNEKEKKDTLLMSQYKNNKYTRIEKDFDLVYIMRSEEKNAKGY